MLDHDGQREAMSLMFMSDRRVPTQQAEPTEPLADLEDAWNEQAEDNSDENRNRAIAATREATERRLRLQSEQLKRFHQQICLRVNERVLQQREEKQSRDKRIDAKMARLLQLPSSADGQTSSTDASRKTTPLELRRTPQVESLLNAKRDQLKGSGTTLVLVEKVLRQDARAREMLLASTRVSRVRESRDCDELALNASYEEEDNQASEGNRSSYTRDDLSLPTKQRVQLYAAVRRRYMAMERERVKGRAKDVDNQAETRRAIRFPPKSKPIAKNQATGDERRGDASVRVVDVSTGCEVKLQRQSAKSSSTPWRGSPSQQPPSSTRSQGKATTHERFLTALQEQLGTPALCSCGSQKGRAQCANDCEFYRQPKRKERAATSVCKQHGARA